VAGRSATFEFICFQNVYIELYIQELQLRNIRNHANLFQREDDSTSYKARDALRALSERNSKNRKKLLGTNAANTPNLEALFLYFQLSSFSESLDYQA
jgi:hypothetical protein